MHDWEVEVVSGFELLYSQRLTHGGEDTTCSIPSKRKSFEVKSCYQVLSNPVRYTFRWKSIWKVKAHSRAVFFVWTATLRKIIVLDNL